MNTHKELLDRALRQLEIIADAYVVMGTERSANVIRNKINEIRQDSADIESLPISEVGEETAVGRVEFDLNVIPTFDRLDVALTPIIEHSHLVATGQTRFIGWKVAPRTKTDKRKPSEIFPDGIPTK